jgi:23S rRNA-/tRNA-specific pseudouridylate synthase
MFFCHLDFMIIIVSWIPFPDIIISLFLTIGEYSFFAPADDPATKPNLHLANRLDRDTSGLMVITKCNRVAGKLVKAFTDHEVKKTYLALCIGCPPTWEKIKICSGHGRSKHGAWRVYAMSDVGRSLPGGSLVRDMSTKFEVLGVNGQGQFREPYSFDTDGIESITVQGKATNQISNDEVKNSMILVRAYPQSGRTHQIRLHCQYLGFPLRGDVKYGGVIEWNGIEYDGHALHAESLEFVHPVTGLPTTFRSPLPSWAKDFISIMK